MANTYYKVPFLNRSGDHDEIVFSSLARAIEFADEREADRASIAELSKAEVFGDLANFMAALIGSVVAAQTVGFGAGGEEILGDFNSDSMEYGMSGSKIEQMASVIQ